MTVFEFNGAAQRDAVMAAVFALMSITGATAEHWSAGLFVIMASIELTSMIFAGRTRRDAPAPNLPGSRQA